MNASTTRGSRIRLLGLYLLAVLLSYILATLFSTQSVISNLGEMGVSVGPGERLRMGGYDLLGMASIFLPVIAAGFAIALPIAGFLSWRNPAYRTGLYALAGALALITIHKAMEFAFGVIFIAGARTTLGLAAQALAGAIGGFAFARWSGSPR